MFNHDQRCEVRGAAEKAHSVDASASAGVESLGGRPAGDKQVTVIPPSVWNDLNLDAAARSKATRDSHGNFLLPDLGLASPSADLSPRKKATAFNHTFQSDNHGDVVVNDTEFYIPPLVETSRKQAAVGTAGERLEPAPDNDLGGLPEWKDVDQANRAKSGSVEVERKRTEGTGGSYSDTWQSDGSLRRVSKETTADGTPVSVEQYYYDDHQNLTKMTARLSTGCQESYSYQLIRHADGTISSERESGEIKFPHASKPVKHVYRKRADGQVEDIIVPN